MSNFYGRRIPEAVPGNVIFVRVAPWLSVWCHYDSRGEESFVAA
jgi:hypothetical protein